MWAIKTPKGVLVTSSSNDDHEIALEDFINSQIDAGLIKDIPKWHGPHFIEKMWEVLSSHGFQVVECCVVQREKDGWRWPELIQLPHQTALFE